MASQLEFEDPATKLQDGSSLIAIRDADAEYVQSKATIICFHGSGDDAAKSLAMHLSRISMKYHTIMFDRGPKQIQAGRHAKFLHQYVTESACPRPVILLAHSAGGLYAKQYLKDFTSAVDGVVLVETGKAHEPTFEHPFTKPLVVISGNSMLFKRRQLEESQVPVDDKLWTQLMLAEQQDQQLEQEQFRWSKNARSVQAPDCGHHVIRDNPELVLQEIDELVQQIIEKKLEQRAHWFSPIPAWFRRLTR